MRAWIQPTPVELPEGLVEAVGSRPLAELLYRRGYTTPEAALAFLTGGIDVDAPGLPDLEEGVALLCEAVIRGERICVYGDYDTDGMTATTLLVDLLRTLGADVTYYIPNRFRDGYGMNARTVEALAAEGTALLLTCDCGIRNIAEVALARKLGMRVVVTDHHELGPELPMAEAVINPKRLEEGHPCRMLPGVGTAYLVARQLLQALDHHPDEADRWLDLVAVGIIADLVPLDGANRELARRGMARLNTSPCFGLQALMEVSGLAGHVTEEDIAFQLVPRLNAAGRLADAALGVRLLLAPGVEAARDLAEQLNELNTERKKLTASVVEAAVAEVAEGAGAILLYRPEWHEGVLGIAAGRLAEEHGVPALLLTQKQGQGGGLLVGSARAPAGFALHEALEACSEHLLKHGGHDAAAGFSLLEEHFAAFRASMLEEARRRTKPGAVAPPRPADLAIPMREVDRALYEELRRAAPFGEANPDPVILSRGVKLLSSRPIGPGDKHLRVVMRDEEQSLIGIWFGAGALMIEPQEVDLFYRLGINRYGGQEMLQAVIEHLGPSVADQPAVEPVAVVVRPELVDRRGVDPWDLLREFPEAALFAEGERYPGLLTVDRYDVSRAADLALLSPPPSARLLDEAVAQSGARRLIMAWPLLPRPEEERFLPTLMRLVAEAIETGPHVSLAGLAVRTGELEIAVREALEALADSDLLAIDETEGDLLRLRRRTDGRGIKESPALARMRALVAESRAYRRFLRKGERVAIDRAIYSG